MYMLSVEKYKQNMNIPEYGMIGVGEARERILAGQHTLHQPAGLREFVTFCSTPPLTGSGVILDSPNVNLDKGGKGVAWSSRHRVLPL